MDSQAAFLPQGFGTAQATVAAFWLLFGVPGFAVLKRWLPASLEGGGLGAVALSYLASFAVISPLSMLGYALHLPLWVLSVAVAIALALSVEWCVRNRAQLGLSRPSWLALACVMLIAVDMLLGLRAGSHFGGDARYHISRVRILLDLGFNSWDPLVPGHRFDEVYHTNLYHALLAVSAQLTAIEAPAAWAFCWFFAKLVCAGGMYQLTWTVLGQRWLAWISAALFALWMASDSIMPYPNMISTYWLLPLALSFLVEACTGPARAWPAIGLGAIAVVMPQVHLLYYVFACLLIGPVLAFRVLRARMRKQPQRTLTWALLALGLGAPFMGVTLWQRSHRSAPPPSARAHPAPVDPHHLPWSPDNDAKRIAGRDRGFLQLPNGMKMLDPFPSFRPGAQQLQLVVLLAAGAIFGRRRKQMAVLAGVFAIVLAALYLPPLCSALIKVAGAPFVVRRLTGVPSAMHLALVPCALAVLLPEALSRERLHGAWLGVALVYAYLNGLDAHVWTRSEYLADALAGRPLYGGLHAAAMRRELCLRNVPREAVVATALGETGMTQACSAYPLALPLREPTHGVKDMTQRRVDALALLDPDADAGKRIAILRYYDVRHIWVRGEKNFGALRRAYQPWLVKVDQYHGDRIMTLDLKKKGVNPQPTPSPR